MDMNKVVRNISDAYRRHIRKQYVSGSHSDGTNTSFRADLMFTGRIVENVDYLDALDKAVTDGFWVNPQKLVDIMDEDRIARNLEPLLTAAVIPALWRLEGGKNLRPVIIGMPYDQVCTPCMDFQRLTRESRTLCP
jgi:hypothetical protein